MNPGAVAISQQQAQARNAHGEAAFQHTRQGVVSTSPVTAQVIPNTTAMIRGETELLRDRTTSVQHIRGSRFTVDGVRRGIDTSVIGTLLVSR